MKEKKVDKNKVDVIALHVTQGLIVVHTGDEEELDNDGEEEDEQREVVQD